MSLTSFGAYCAPLTDGDWYGWVLQSNARDGSDTRRVIDIAEAFIEDLQKVKVGIITFEDYGPINRTSGKIAQRAEICGILKYFALTTLRVPVVTVPPTALKSFATGNGRASKEMMLDAAAKHGYYPDTNDEADAFFAARLGSFVANAQKTGVSFTLTNPVT